MMASVRPTVTCLLLVLSSITVTSTVAIATPDDRTTAPAPDVPDVDVGVFVYYDNESASDDVTMRQVLGPDDVARVDPVETDDASGRAFVTVTLTDDAAERFQREMVAAGFGDGGTCNYEEQPGQPGECLLTVVDGEVVYSAGVHQNLGTSFRSGSFADDPRFVLNAPNRSVAERIRAALDSRAGPATSDTSSTTMALAEATRTGGSTNSDSGLPTPGLTPVSALAAVSLAVATLRRR
jgi:hypothetical protein